MNPNANIFVKTEYTPNPQIKADFLIRSLNVDFEEMFINEIWHDDYYFRDGFGLEEGMRVLDIGGHIGTFSILADKLGSPVVAFEPVIDNLRLFIKNMQRNGCLKILPIFGAIGGKNQFSNVNIPDANFETNTGKSYVGNSTEHYNQQTIAVYSISEVLKMFGKFDYIKLDCEGAEYDIIYSMTDEELKSAKVYSMEFHGHVDKARELESYFQSKGFTTRLDWAWGEQGSLKCRI